MYNILERYGLLGCNAMFGIRLPMFHADIMLTTSVMQCIFQNVDVFLLDYTQHHITQSILSSGIPVVYVTINKG